MLNGARPKELIRIPLNLSALTYSQIFQNTIYILHFFRCTAQTFYYRDALILCDAVPAHETAPFIITIILQAKILYWQLKKDKSQQFLLNVCSMFVIYLLILSG